MLESLYKVQFLDQVYFDPNTGCWLWIGTIQQRKDGGHSYPYFHDAETGEYAHRYSYAKTYGPIPKGRDLQHQHCETARCVNPAHLKMLTRKERQLLTPNTFRHRYAVRTHCKNGHALTPDNVKYVPSAPTSRRCRTCERAFHAKYEREWGSHGKRKAERQK